MLASFNVSQKWFDVWLGAPPCWNYQFCTSFKMLNVLCEVKYKNLYLPPVQSVGRAVGRTKEDLSKHCNSERYMYVIKPMRLILFM